MKIRPAAEADVPLILALIRELAEFEKLLHELTATEDRLRENLFGARRYAEVVLAFAGEECVGYALYFHTFSTFVGKPGLYLEDVYVRPAHRGRGYGKGLLQHVAKVACERGCGRLEWTVLNWNERAIQFYKNLGAEPLGEWTVYRLTGAPLRKLADF